MAGCDSFQILSDLPSHILFVAYIKGKLIYKKGYRYSSVTPLPNRIR